MGEEGEFEVSEATREVGERLFRPTVFGKAKLGDDAKMFFGDSPERETCPPSGCIRLLNLGNKSDAGKGMPGVYTETPLVFRDVPGVGLVEEKG
jgi:hypothetical protein